MKKSWLLITSILLINLVSAQGISEILNSIDQTTMILYAAFIISFCILFFSLSKTLFKGPQSKVFAAVISAVISLLIVYGLNQMEFDFSGYFFDLGISEDMLLTIIPIIIIAGIIFVIFKFAKDSLFIIGGFSIILGFFVEEKVLLFVIGGILIITRLFIIPKNSWLPSQKNSGNSSVRSWGP
jgi:hypothetical protein